MPEQNTSLMAVAVALGLTASASVDAITQAASNERAKVADLTEELAKLRKAVGAPENADIHTALAAAQNLATAAEKPNPAKFVNIEAHTAVTTELASVKKKLQDEAVAVAINAGMKAGKLTPAMKEWATNYASSDMAGFNAYIEKAPVILTQGASATEGRAENADGELTTTEIAACKAMGINQKDFKETKAKDAAKRAAA